MTIKEIEEIMTPEEKQVYELALDYGLFDSLPEILEKLTLGILLNLLLKVL